MFDLTIQGLIGDLLTTSNVLFNQLIEGMLEEVGNDKVNNKNHYKGIC